MSETKKPEEPTQADGRRMPGYKKGKINEVTRERIQVAKIVDALEAHVIGKRKMSATKIKAAEILLRKTLPDLSASKLDLDAAPILFVFGRVAPKAGEDAGA